MRGILLALLALQVASPQTIHYLEPKNSGQGRQTLQEWEAFKRRFGKSYESPEEENLRFAIFNANIKMIREHNSLFRQDKRSFSMKMNKFADFLTEEFVAIMNGYQQHKKVRRQGATLQRLVPEIKLPDSIDWRTKGAVTPVKDQGQCGSCWAFSATGSLEGQHFRKTGRLVDLSEQNLIDCSTSFGNNGCEGGLMDNAFKYVKANGGIDTEESYPYQATDESCHFKKEDVGATDVGYIDIPAGDEEALKEAVAVHGPISIAIDASQSSFQFYHSGIYDDPNCSSTELDHGVLAVGYGTDESGRDYWLVKNSWSTDWGDDGYIKIARNANNACGVVSMASFPLV